MTISAGLELAERGWLPESVLRWGIRRMLADRLEEKSDPTFLKSLDESRIALVPEKANEQHYEVPAAFFETVLGPRLKYSCAHWPQETDSLAAAEESMLDLTCRRAALEDGQDILELGCGWGSLSLWMAERYPNSRILAVSNSAPQRRFIEARAPRNLQVLTADMNDFATGRCFDRVVSVEMFEHMRNHRKLMHRIGWWLRPEGKLFVHVFCHKDRTYPFETDGADNWMGRHFFTGGLMPAADLLPRYQDDLRLEESWPVDGRHYERTANAWLQNLEAHRDEILRILAKTYGPGDARRWYHRWRIFFLACAELFGFRGGKEWFVMHYRFARR